MSEVDLKLIGKLVDGTFFHEENEVLIYGSNTFPSHRITVNKAKAQEYLDNLANRIDHVVKSAHLSRE